VSDFGHGRAPIAPDGRRFSQGAVNYTSNSHSHFEAIIEIITLYVIGTPRALHQARARWWVWIDKKGNHNDLDSSDPQRRHRFRRCLHYRAPVRLGRDLAVDRLKPSNPRETEMNGRFLINRRDAKVMGVAAGLADYSGIDPTIVRLGIVALTLVSGPLMIFFYVLTGLLAPQQ
jgi:phage shock protein C